MDKRVGPFRVTSTPAGASGGYNTVTVSMMVPRGSSDGEYEVQLAAVDDFYAEGREGDSHDGIKATVYVNVDRDGGQPDDNPRLLHLRHLEER